MIYKIYTFQYEANQFLYGRGISNTGIFFKVAF